ncbi:MAG: ParB/RepB/Spo0J family partition protein [Acholeplasmataceae bacterium]|nr:ParB/RepB/Spo0J family partition protein [Acholeplasmataceae bacterium]
MKDDKTARSFIDLLKEHHVDDVLEGEIIDEINLLEIKPNPFQPRRMFDQEKINELAQSIKEHGVFQPIILKKVKEGYIIVSGERRYRAAQQIGLKSIPAIIRQYEESKVAEIALAENLQRENLTPIEEADAYRVVMDKMKLTQAELAEKIGKSRSHVTNIIGLLNLPKEVQTLLLTSQLSMGHARALSKLENAKQITKLANLIIQKSLSVRQIEELTKIEEKTNKIKRVKPRVFERESEMLSHHFGQLVKVDEKKITIHLNENTMNEIIERLLKK